MSTPILKVLSQYCGVYVDDIRLQELAEANPPLYARRMYNYLRPAITLFNQPAHMQEYFFGTSENPQFVDPVMDSTVYLVEDEESTDFIVPLGAAYSGFDLCACQVKTYDDLDNAVLTPIQITYDEASGNVTVHATPKNNVPQNAILVFDFYTDGEFTETVSEATTEEDGVIHMYGLAYGTYYIVETKAPEHYNLLTEPVTVEIDSNSHLEEATVHIYNTKFFLPETGGMGTTLFTVLGAVFISGALILSFGSMKKKEGM